MNFEFFSRLEIQYLMRCSKRDFRDADVEKLQKLRQALVPLLATLHKLQHTAGALKNSHPNTAGTNDNLAYWDDLHEHMDQETNTVSMGSSDADVDSIPPKDIVLCLPSNGNIPARFAGVELQMQTNQALTELNQIWDIITDMSFRWTAQVRNAPNKGVHTKGHAVLKDCEKALSLHCQVYS